MTTAPAQGPFSNFTINRNNANGTNTPTLRGKITVIDIDGKPVEFEHAAWGPNAAQGDKREYYSIRITPTDPALAARQAQMQNGNLPMPAVPNPIDGMTMDKIGAGAIFETTEAERQASIAAGKKARSFFGSALVLLPSGPRVIDLAARPVEGYSFHSGWANHHDPVKAAEARAAKQAAAAAHRAPAPKPRKPTAELG